MKNEIEQARLSIKIPGPIYLHDLMEAAYRHHLLDDRALNRIQLESVELLTQRVYDFTKGKSSSVPEETAETIMGSIAFTLSLYLKNLGDHDAALLSLKEEPLANLYQKGRNMIDEQVKWGRFQLEEVKKTRLPIEHIAYNDTITKGLSGFFLTYDRDFAAQEIPASIDYPLSEDLTNLAGIQYINHYLQNLRRENQFCLQYPPEEIEALLRGHAENYAHLLINIFMPVFIHALRNFIIGKPGLTLCAKDRNDLKENLTKLSREERESLLYKGATQLAKGDNPLHEYLSAAVPSVLEQMEHALELQQMDTFFVTSKGKPELIYFVDKEKMDDESFRNFAEELTNCRLSTDKAKMIKDTMHCFADIWDLFGAGCLFDDEFDAVFAVLDETTLALLYQKLPTAGEEASLHTTAEEASCQERLTLFFAQMDAAKRKRILTLAKKIRLS